jgi:lysophospholipase L1-like esterase
LAVELVATLLAKALPAAAAADPRAQSAAFEGSAWAGAYFRELEACGSMRWQPYTYWRRQPFQGTFINIDAAGERRTVEPADLAADAQEIWLFGGSTLWGTGSRDGGTLPSQLSALLNSEAPRWRLRNFGEAGYVGTQARIALSLALGQGRAPALVIFYEGVNDCLSAFQQARAGLPLQEGFRALEFNSRLGAAFPRVFDESSGRWQPRSPLTGWQALWAGSSTAQWLRRFELLPRLEGRLAPAAALELDSPPHRDPAALAAAVVATAVHNQRWARTLCTAAGTRCLTVWQPDVYHKQQTAEEAALAAQYPGQREFFLEVARQVANHPELAADPDFLFLTRLFSSDPRTLFFDFCHVNEAANRSLAEALVSPVQARLP